MGALRKPKNIPFDEALVYLKRNRRVARERWKGFYLELIEDVKGNKEIRNSSGINTSVRHTFDQEEILACDWRVI